MEIEEAKRIISDSTHPQHARFWQGDPYIGKEVQEAYERAYPGEIDLSSDDSFQRALNERKGAYEAETMRAAQPTGAPLRYLTRPLSETTCETPKWTNP